MDITSALHDPELGCTSFTVERITYTRSREGTASRSVTVPARGCIHPGTAETLKLLPEEEVNGQFIAVYTDYPLSTGTPEDDVSFIGADRIHWNGRIWRASDLSGVWRWPSDKEFSAGGLQSRPG